MKEEENVPKKLDIFRDTPVRYLGYANEVGEAFRQLIPSSVVRFSYAIATTYCLSDATSKAIEVKKQDVSSSNKSSNRRSIEMFIEAAVWQGLASVILPGFTINRICWMSAILLKNKTFLSSIQQKWLVTSIGLGSVPVIIKPIDSLVDEILDKSIKLSTQFGVEHKISHDEQFHQILEHDSQKAQKKEN